MSDPRADALEHSVGADAACQPLDAGYGLVAAFADVSVAPNARQRLPRRVAAHRDDSLRAPLLRREHAEQANRAIAHRASILFVCVSGVAARMYLAPRGIQSVIDGLKDSTIRYAITGSWAAAPIAPVAPPRLLLVYVDGLKAAEGALGLRPTEAGSNVALLTPFDAVVFERTSERAGATIAAVSQIAADLLTSPGRGPNEAEALMTWMSENEDAWRA